MNRKPFAAFVSFSFLAVVLGSITMLTVPVAAQNCPCSAIKLGVDTTKGMKFDTVAYHSSSDSTLLISEYFAAKRALLSLDSLEYDSTELDTGVDANEIKVKRYGTRTPLPYDYITYVTVGRKGKKLKDFNYKLTFVVKDSSMANDTLLFDTVHEKSLAHIPADLDSLEALLTPTLRWIARQGRTLGVDTIRGVTFDTVGYRASKDSTELLAAYAQVSELPDSLLGFCRSKTSIGLAVVPFGFVDRDVDLGRGLTGNGSGMFDLIKIKNNYWVLDTINLFNTTPDSITVTGIRLGPSPYYKLVSIVKTDTTKKEPLPVTLGVGGRQQVIIRVCHAADTSAFNPEPIITNALVITTTNAPTPVQAYSLQATPVHSSYDYVSSVTLDRKGKTLKSFDYKLTWLVKDAATGDTVKFDTVHTGTLDSIPIVLHDAVQPFTPLLHFLRAYQKKIREDSSNHYIGLKYTILPDQTVVTSKQTTTLHVHVYDCDGTNIGGKHFAIELKQGSECTLSSSEITTDDSGNAEVTFTAGTKLENAKAKLKYVYASVTHHKVNISDCNSKGVSVAVPYKLTVDASLEVESNAGNTGDFKITGNGPMRMYIPPDDTCPKWEFTDSSSHGPVWLTMTGQWKAAKGATCTFNGPSYNAAATFQMDGCSDGSTGTLHLDNIGPSSESYECCCPSVPGGTAGPFGAVDVILSACFNSSKMHHAQASGEDEISKLKALAAQVNASQRSGKKMGLSAYGQLMKAVQNISPGQFLQFDFKDQVHTKDATAFDYTPPIDAVESPEATKTAHIHVKIEKDTNE